jgi:hypothetical protein
MKYILFLIFSTGAAPVTPEHHFAMNAEFDDRAVCEAAMEGFKNLQRYRVEALCLPKSVAGMSPEGRKRWEEKFPPGEYRPLR